MNNTPQKNGKPFRVKLLIAGIAVVGLLLGADWLMRNIEMNRLLSAVERSERAMRDLGARLEAIDVTYSAQEARLEWWQSGRREEIRQAKIDAWEEAASDTAAEVIETRVEIEEVAVLPWHRAINRAKASYLDHSTEWEDVLIDVSAGKPAGRRPKIEATFNIAGRAFRRAVPPFPLFGIQNRIADIW